MITIFNPDFNGVKSYELVRETWKENKILFGLIKWNRLIKKETIGEALIIQMERIPEDIIVNGIKYIMKKENLT